jgi:glycosyltransferase involved in cell wall biosynthesis
MRVLYLSADPGIPIHGDKGASIHVRALVSGLSELGHEVIVASPRIEPGSASLPGFARTVEIPAVRPRECDTAAEVIAQAEKQARVVRELALSERVAGTYERYSLSAFAGARASQALDLPLVAEVNAPLREEERRFRHLCHEAVAEAAERETFASARRIVAVSDPLVAWLVSLGVPRERVELIPNPPPARKFATKSPLTGDREIVVGFAGGMKPWQGVETLIRGCELAVRAGGRIRLEVLGRGPLDAIIDNAELPRGSLKRWGQLPHADALDVLERWDVGVAPYGALEGFYFSPLKLAEYMAAGLCPVVSDVDGLAQMVRQGQAGVLIPPDDPQALADALLALDRDRARLRELGRRAQRAAAEQRGWREIAAWVAAVLDEALLAPAAWSVG